MTAPISIACTPATTLAEIGSERLAYVFVGLLRAFMHGDPADMNQCACYVSAALLTCEWPENQAVRRDLARLLECAEAYSDVYHRADTLLKNLHSLVQDFAREDNLHTLRQTIGDGRTTIREYQIGRGQIPTVSCAV